MTWWLLAGSLAFAALAPLGFALLRPAAARGRREADLSLYRRQLAELERERAAGRLDEAGHAAAVLEVQRRLLAAPGAAEAAPAAKTGRAPLLAALVAVPALAAGLYLANGSPGLPAAPFSERQDVAAQEEHLLGLLRARLATADPTSETTRQGWVLLANSERGRGWPDAAAEAYARALAVRFDAELAGQRAQALLEANRTEEAARFLAEALPRAPNHVGLRFLTGLAEARAGRPETARTLWRALVAEAPADAPWRAMVERRMLDLP